MKETRHACLILGECCCGRKHYQRLTFGDFKTLGNVWTLNTLSRTKQHQDRYIKELWISCVKQYCGLKNKIPFGVDHGISDNTKGGFAQIAIALAGFTTIASVLVQISERTTANLVAARLESILTFSMLLVVMSVLPITFYYLATQGDQFWHYAAIGSLIVSSLAAYIGLFHVLPKVVKDPHNSWLQTISALVFAFGGSANLVLTLLRDNPAFWYFAAMALTLAACLTMIIGFVLSFPVFDVLRKSEMRGTENS